MAVHTAYGNHAAGVEADRATLYGGNRMADNLTAMSNRSLGGNGTAGFRDIVD